MRTSVNVSERGSNGRTVGLWQKTAAGKALVVLVRQQRRPFPVRHGSEPTRDSATGSEPAPKESWDDCRGVFKRKAQSAGLSSVLENHMTLQDEETRKWTDENMCHMTVGFTPVMDKHVDQSTSLTGTVGGVKERSP